WYKPAGDPSGWWLPPFDIDIIRTPDEAKKFIPTSGRTAFIGEWDDAFHAWGKLESNPPALLNRLHFDRAWKTEYEIESIHAVNDMQQSLCDMVRPKVDYIDIHLAAHRAVADILKRFDFVKDLDADGILQKRISSTFLPHGVGHYLGLQVHDVGGFQKDVE